MVGEAGEACNVIKKLNRIRDGLVGNHGDDTDKDALMRKLGKEIADVVIYCDLMAQAVGMDLSTCVQEKFNEVSERNGFSERV
jgi:NTP pyrophosphatase (non-canonical NTP hydrolase)